MLNATAQSLTDGGVLCLSWSGPRQLRSELALLHQARALLTERGMMPGAACGNVSRAVRDFRALQPSQSDNPCKASESIGLDTPSLRQSLRLLDGVLILLAP